MSLIVTNANTKNYHYLQLAAIGSFAVRNILNLIFTTGKNIYSIGVDCSVSRLMCF